MFFGTIVALPIGGINCDVAGESSEGYNFSDDDSCGLDQATDKVATPNDRGSVRSAPTVGRPRPCSRRRGAR